MAYSVALHWRNITFRTLAINLFTCFTSFQYSYWRTLLEKQCQGFSLVFLLQWPLNRQLTSVTDCSDSSKTVYIIYIVVIIRDFNFLFLFSYFILLLLFMEFIEKHQKCLKISDFYWAHQGCINLMTNTVKIV